MSKVAIVGPAYPLRGGGLATFNERLARAFMAAGDEVVIYTFSLQYPGFLFPGTTQYSTSPPPQDLKIKVLINSMNPVNWIFTGNRLKNEHADLIIVRYWLPFMGPSLGTILRIARKNRSSKIICIADNIIPHESRPGDTWFTRYFVKPVDAFITMSDKVMNDLRRFTSKPALKVVHPLYDNFGDKLPVDSARKFLGIGKEEKVILFFGFIRKYKGLDLLLEAMKILKDENVLPELKLLIAGDFYEDRKQYDDLIEQLQLHDRLILKTGFIADEEVKYYLSAADFVIQPYRNATQSGVTPLAYHFEKPMLVTNVGSLPDFVPDGKAGVVCEPNPISIAAGIKRLYNLGVDHFVNGIQDEKKKYSWKNLVEGIKKMGEEVK